MFESFMEFYEFLQSIEGIIKQFKEKGYERKQLVVLLPSGYKGDLIPRGRDGVDTILGVQVMYNVNIPKGQAIVTKKELIKIPSFVDIAKFQPVASNEDLQYIDRFQLN